MRNATMFAAAVLVAALAAGGCKTETEGEMTSREGVESLNAGETIQRGETMVVDGKAEVTRGEELKRLGDQDGGDAAIRAGKDMVADGERMIRDGRAAKPK